MAEQQLGIAARSGEKSPDVLVVDDEPAVINALKRSLGHFGYRLVGATDAQQALDLLTSMSDDPIYMPRVIISDYKMPGMDGLTFLIRVKQNWPVIQRVLVTGFADLEVIERAINEAGIYRFIEKPWDQLSLLAVVRSAIEQWQVVYENQRLIDSQEGLTLYFNTRLTPIDRFLIDGVIFARLGNDTDCQVVEFKQGKDMATVRIQAASRQDLEAVAEALNHRVWEQHRQVEQQIQAQALVKAQQQVLDTFSGLLGAGALAQLSDLRQRLDSIELRLRRVDPPNRVGLVHSWTTSKTAELRRLMDVLFLTDGDLEAFCLDYFPVVSRRFTNGMNRVEKINLLLKAANIDEIWERLGEHYPQAGKPS